jgi:hypothetical protein
MQLLVAGMAVIALASCSSRNGIHDTGSVQGQSRRETATSIGGSAERLASGAQLMLRDGWQVQTSSNQPDGGVISKAGFVGSGWYSTAIPATVGGGAPPLPIQFPSEPLHPHAPKIRR